MSARTIVVPAQVDREVALPVLESSARVLVAREALEECRRADRVLRALSLEAAEVRLERAEAANNAEVFKIMAEQGLKPSEWEAKIKAGRSLEFVRRDGAPAELPKTHTDAEVDFAISRAIEEFKASESLIDVAGFNDAMAKIQAPASVRTLPSRDLVSDSPAVSKAKAQ